MTRTAAPVRDPRSEADPAPRTWECTARPSQRPQQRKAPPGNLHKTLVWMGSGVGFVVAVAVGAMLVIALMVPVLVAVFWMLLWLGGGGTGGTD